MRTRLVMDMLGNVAGSVQKGEGDSLAEVTQ
jgi:hypothetical protein